MRLTALLLTLTLFAGCSSQPAPAPQPQPQPDAPQPVAPASDYFSLRFKGWTDSEVDDVIQTLEGNKAFGDFNHRGQTGVYSVYEVRYTGGAIAGAVRAALEENQLNNRAEITVSGNDVNVIKTGR